VANRVETAERSLQEGNPHAALRHLQDAVREKPADAKLRVFLFQLLAVLGQWQRALVQLDTAATLDPGALAMKQTYHEAIACERLRAEVFAGRKSPMVLGQPEEWLAGLIESLAHSGRGAGAAAETLRAAAFDQAPATSGTLDGQAFEWIADADMRLGPVLEAIVNGRYYWIPFARIARLTIEAPADLRDVVWAPAHIAFANGGETVALIPTRYPGSELSEDGAILLSRKTVWSEPRSGVFHGLGQRVLATDVAEHPVLEVREIRLSPAAAGGA